MPSQLETLLQQARSGLANTNNSLLNNRYPAYPGQTSPEMSAMTNRKRQIEDQYRLKRPSYTRAIQHNTHRNLGFRDGDVQGLLDRISTQQQNLGRFGTQRIKNTFGDTYSGNLEGKINKDTLAKNAQSKVGFDNLANEARNIDTRDTNKTLQTLNALSLSKNATKEGVLGLLDQLGNQKHAYDQSKFNADRAMFNRQVNYPYSKLQGVGDAISGGLTIADAVRRDRLNAEQGGEFNPLTPTPSEEGYAENRLRRGINSLNTSYPVYPGKLVADLNPDMKLSYNLAERLEPNIQDNSYEERRRLRKGLTDGDITSQRAISSLNDKASPLEQNLDKDAQRLIKQATAKINASRVMNGTFGSKSHQSELDAAIRDIVSGKYGSRANITTDTLNRSLTDLSRENDVNNERVRELDRTGSREISDALNQIRNINQRGVTQWGNEQNALNQAFQQFSDESDWENNNRGNLGSNPQNRGLAIAGGIDRAGSQSPLVLPQALQFNNLQANIPFEESKVAAPTTDPRIQRTSQLFNDEEEMQRIAEAARERQNREELARREQELVRQRAVEEEARRAQEAARQQEANRIRAQQEEERRRAEAEYRRQAEAELNNFKSFWKENVGVRDYYDGNFIYNENPLGLNDEDKSNVSNITSDDVFRSNFYNNPGYRLEEFINSYMPQRRNSYQNIIEGERRYHGNNLSGESRLRDFLDKTKQNSRDINSWLYKLNAERLAKALPDSLRVSGGLSAEEARNAVNNHLLHSLISQRHFPHLTRHAVHASPTPTLEETHTFVTDWFDKVKNLIKENPNHEGGNLHIFDFIHGGDRGTAVPVHWMDDPEPYLRQMLKNHFEAEETPEIYTAKPPKINTKTQGLQSIFERNGDSYSYPNPEIFSEEWKNQPNNRLKNKLLVYLNLLRNTSGVVDPSRLNPIYNRMREIIFPTVFSGTGRAPASDSERRLMMALYRPDLIRTEATRASDIGYNTNDTKTYKNVQQNIEDYLTILRAKGIRL